MAEQHTRGRASKVDLLPPEIKSQLSLMLRDKRYTQIEIREAINELIKECGLPEEMQLSRTGLNRYAQRMEKIGAKIRQAREVAEVWTRQFGEMPESDIGKTVIELVKHLAFEMSSQYAENGIAEPKELATLATTVQRLEQAASLSYERERKLRREIIEEAAKAVEEAGKAQGLQMADVENMLKAVYGIGA